MAVSFVETNKNGFWMPSIRYVDNAVFTAAHFLDAFEYLPSFSDFRIEKKKTLMSKDRKQY